MIEADVKEIRALIELAELDRLAQQAGDPHCQRMLYVPELIRQDAPADDAKSRRPGPAKPHSVAAK